MCFHCNKEYIKCNGIDDSTCGNTVLKVSWKFITDTTDTKRDPNSIILMVDFKIIQNHISYIKMTWIWINKYIMFPQIMPQATLILFKNSTV